MSLQYSGGTYINRTSVISTRQGWCDFVAQACVDAGWSLITGPIGSATVVVETPAGNSNQKIRAAFFEPGTGNCAQAFIRHSSGSPTSQAFFALPGGSTWRVVATKNHFFALVSGAGSRTTPRTFVCGGQLWTPPFLPYSAGDALGWMYGNGINDTDVTGRPSWRSTLAIDTSVTNALFSGFNVATLQNYGSWVASIGAPSIANWQGGYVSDGSSFYRWQDGTLPAYEPLVCWSTTGVSAEGKFQGQMYDAMVMNDSWASETAISYDGHSWIALTDNAGALAIRARATLFLAVT